MRTGRTMRSATTLLCVALLTGCSALPAATAGPSLSAGSSPSPTAAASSNAAPSAGSTPVATATSGPESTLGDQPSPSPSSQVTSPPIQGPPPLGTLSADGVAPVAGQQGSWCYGGQCVDTGGAAKRSLPTLILDGSNTRLTFAMPPGATFVHWSAWYSASLGGRPIILGEGGSIYDVDAPPATAYPELNSAAFPAPSGGDWALAVRLGFDGRDGGDVTYYWRVVVP
jgi:hypothetical protein